MPIPEPHGGKLNDLVERDLHLRANLLKEITEGNLDSVTLTDRQLCDLELLLNGGFSPLEGFLNEDDYRSVVENMRLTSVRNDDGSGLLWPMPIVLDVNQAKAAELKKGQRLVLLDPRDKAQLAILTIQSIYQPDKKEEAVKVFRGDPEHPAVKYLCDKVADFYVGGTLQGLAYPKHYDYSEFRKTPRELRQEFVNLGWDKQKIVAFQTRNPMHRAHRELTVRAAKDIGDDGHILVHPVVGLTKPGDIDHHTRVKVYKEILRKYPEGLATLSLLPLAMRMGGDREALWHALIRMNYGVDHFIVGRDHAGPGKNSSGVDFYGPYDAQDLLKSLETELSKKIKIVPFRMVTYLPQEDRYAPIDTIDLQKVETANISGTELRQRLRDGTDIPEWFSYPEVVKILRDSNPPRFQQGFLVSIKVAEDLSKGDILAFALEAALNEVSSGRRITRTKSDDKFLIGELVLAGAGVILVSKQPSTTFALSIPSSNVLPVDASSNDKDYKYAGSSSNVADTVSAIVSGLTNEGFFGKS